MDVRVIIKHLIVFISVVFFVGCTYTYDFDDYIYKDKVFQMIGEDLSTQEDVANWVYENIQYIPEGFDADGKEFNYWKSPYETVKDRGGDCEDAAILYMYLLYEVTGEKTEAIAVLTSRGNHMVVESNRYSYYYSPQIPDWKLTDSICRVLQVNTYDKALNKSTNYGSKGVF